MAATTTAGFSPAEAAGLLAGGLAPRQLRDVLARFASLADYERASPEERGNLPALAPVEVQFGPDDWAVVLGSPEYPAALAASPIPPPVLFGRGDPGALGLGVAVVGTRAMTRLGEVVAHTAIEAAARLAIPVHSGGALGVDAAAHRRALGLGVATVAVIAGGLDRPSPRGHEQLFEQICASGGAVVTEALPGTAPSPPRLQARNRIPVGLSAAVVVAEASLRSGTMGAVLAAVRAGRSLLVAAPKPAARRLPGAEALIALADERGVIPSRLGATGRLAELVAARAPLADGVATTRDDLAGLIEMAYLFCPQRRDLARTETAAGAAGTGPSAT